MTVSLCHSQSFDKLSGSFNHQCTEHCWKHFPLQTCNSICGISAAMSMSLASFDFDAYLSLKGNATDEHNKYSYLKNVTKYGTFLRLILIQWILENKIDISQIDEQLILKASLRTKGSAGPSGMDAELYRRILGSKNFNTEGKALREEIAKMAKNLLTTSYDPSLLEAYTAARLIPLDQNPGVRPIGVGEVLRRIIGKAITWTVNDEIKEAAGPLQTCAGHGAGAEAAIHAMKEIYENEATDAVLLIDATNAFNCMNRSVALHNIQIICPAIATYVINTYRSPSRLFVAGGMEIKSQEGTTQGDPLAMPWYSVNTHTMIELLKIMCVEIKQVWLADDAAAGGKITSLYEWYNHLATEGQAFGYLVNGAKSWLIVKTDEAAQEAKQVFGDSVNITTEGKRHLGAVFGSKDYKDDYCKAKVDKWTEELRSLSEIAKSQPQAAYAAYVKGYQSKFTFFMRTVPQFDEYLGPIDGILHEFFLPTIFGQEEPLPSWLEKLCNLPTREGGLGISSPKTEAPQQYKSSVLITKPHVESILSQDMVQKGDKSEVEALKREQRNIKKNNEEIKVAEVKAELPVEVVPFFEQARDKGASSWLNALPIEEQGLNLNKEEFRDALRLRYDLPLRDLPSFCTCGESFSVCHALSCKKGGFIAQRHDNIRDILTVLLSKVCHNVQAEPHLQKIDNERFQLRTANISDEARLDIKAGSFWRRGQNAFFDIRVTHVNAMTNQNRSTESIFRQHENEKKRAYLQRVIEVEQGTFTPLVFGTNGGIGRECDLFVKNLASKLALKQNEQYGNIMTWLRTKLSFETVKAALLCVRGSRAPFRRMQEDTIDNFRLNILEADL